MRRVDPPSTATWVLEHLTPGPLDQALAGDLLEGFRSGRSEGWYWRQTLAACAIAWLNNLRAHGSLLVFSFLWSMLAPAWIAIIDKAEFALNAVWFMDLLPSIAVFLFSNLSFITAGVLLYLAAHLRVARTLGAREIKFIFSLTVPLFLVFFFVTFLLMNLYAFPGAVVNLRTITPLGAIADFRMWAMVVRIPYFLTLLCALWRVAPRLSGVKWQPVSLESIGSAPFQRPFIPTFATSLDPFAAKRFFALMVSAGLVNAMIAGFLLCGLPDSHAPTFSSLLVRAVLYVAIGGAAGVTGAWVYWKSPSSPFREQAPVPFPLFALVCASGWVWVPSMMLFFEQISPATAVVALIGATMLAIGLREVTYLAFAHRHSPAIEPERADLFAESLCRAPQEVHGYAIAILIYAGCWALANSWNLSAAALLALSAFLFVWKRITVRPRKINGNNEYTRATLRLACVVIPAVLVTIWALLDGVAHRNRAEAVALAAGDGAGDHSSGKHAAAGSGISGYESIILWPVPEKKQILPPIPDQSSLLVPGTRKPIVIRFDAPYWYFQAPDKRPGPRAYQAHGTPLDADIQAHDFVPLFMEAHQQLGSSIPLNRCREIKVSILNRDPRHGVLNLAVSLTDTTSPGKPSVYLGQQPVVTSQPGNFSDRSRIDGSPAVNEVLQFEIPARAKIRKFDEITVTFLPDPMNIDVGPKIAVQDFELMPR